MNLSNVFRVIGRHKALLVFGILAAVTAALFTAFKIETGSLWQSGTLEPRTQTEYRASTHILVSDPVSVFSSRNAPQVVEEGTTVPGARDLSSLTVVYAYLASSDEMLAQLEEQIGPLGRDESLAAQQRTTQPTAQTNTGTYRLPILDIMGTSPDPARAEEISRTAAAIFQQYAEAQQEAAAVPPESRVQLPVIDEREALAVDGTNPALPVVAVGLGVLLGFIALIFAVDNARTSRRQASLSAAPGSPARESFPAPVAASTVSTGPTPIVHPAPVGQVAYRPAPQQQQAARLPEPATDWTGRPAHR